jgi:predicted ribosome quality control (RQC) complex YloA/Tae2 family protein
LTRDQGINLHSLNRPIDWSYENFANHEENPEKVYFTFGKNIWQYLKEMGFGEKSLKERWNLIQQMLRHLTEGKYYVTEVNSTLILSLVEFGKIKMSFTDPIEAINYFFTNYTSRDTFTREKSKTISSLTNRLHSTEGYVRKTEAKLVEISLDDHYKIWADLIMANLHLIQPASSSIRLPDFYHENRLVEIPLKKDLSPQKNAELYYRKSKNHSIEVEHLQRTLSSKHEEIKNLKNTLVSVNQAEDLKTLRQFTKTSNLLIEKDTGAVPLPYHEFAYNGFRIWVGKNAASNDELTLKYSFKEDLWLHAKDVAGSHVVIKYQAGKKFPKDVIERAAQLAAYHSKRKNETLCPVIVTPKKYVRKRKGDPSGMVVVEREKVIMVEPMK